MGIFLETTKRSNKEELKMGKVKICNKEISLPEKEIENINDGYHTFKELYHHRALLFASIVAMNKDVAWKSKQHSDGTMYDNMFIVGITTPEGNATYHYDIDPYWDMFQCKELDKAPEFDGHTPEVALERIYNYCINYKEEKDDK